MTRSLFHVIYIEKEIQNHPRVQKILQKHPNKPHILIDHYGEIFNRRAQNFRVQKTRPSLILAKKQKNFCIPIPEKYGIGAKNNYYFSHFLNCPFDCNYCFLQGLYLSAHYVFFVNFEDFQKDILAKVQDSPQETFTFFSGYDGDSLAMDPLTGFSDRFISFFKSLPQAQLEIRTKSSFIQPLLTKAPSKNIIIAYTLSPDIVVKELEHKTPSLKKRLDQLIKLQQHNYQLGLRFDPIIYHKDFEKHYSQLFSQVFDNLKLSSIHSVTLGPFRLPRNIYKQMKKNAPTDQLLATCSETDSSIFSYSKEVEQKLMQFCKDKLLTFLPEHKLFLCV